MKLEEILNFADHKTRFIRGKYNYDLFHVDEHGMVIYCNNVCATLSPAQIKSDDWEVAQVVTENQLESALTGLVGDSALVRIKEKLGF